MTGPLKINFLRPKAMRKKLAALCKALLPQCWNIAITLANRQDKTMVLPTNKSIRYAYDDMMRVISEIDYILISLHNIGSYYHNAPGEITEKRRREYERETTLYIDESNVTARLANIRAILTEGFDLRLGDDELDDVERALLDAKYWEQPGDYRKLPVQDDNE